MYDMVNFKGKVFSIIEVNPRQSLKQLLNIEDSLCSCSIRFSRGSVEGVLFCTSSSFLFSKSPPTSSSFLSFA